MRTCAGIDALPRGERLTCTIGVFDGMHRGHHRVLGMLVRVAREERSLATVVTFEPHPEAVLRAAPPALLCDATERLARIGGAGVDLLALQQFDRAFAAQSPEAFLDRLSHGRRLAGLVMTAEAAFGRDREGTLERVRSLGVDRGFRVEEVSPQELRGGRISSSRIRAEVEQGRLSDAARCLGRRYAVIGEVAHGDHRGRELGYPTANLAFDAPVALPPNGVYAVRVSWGGPVPLRPAHRRDGVASLGVRPTFGGGARLLEAHLFDFDGDLYGQRLRVEFIRRQRGEKRFSSVEALVAQMDRDASRARAILERAT